MKSSPLGLVTAAIGDGGNDVSMIQVDTFTDTSGPGSTLGPLLLFLLLTALSMSLQEAHVGIGIIGREGRAAVRASDFAFTRFRFLQKVRQQRKQQQGGRRKGREAISCHTVFVARCC